MKKILNLLLVLIVGVTLFTGCSNKESVEDTETRTEVEIEDVVTNPKQNATNIEKEKKEAVDNAIQNKVPEENKESSDRKGRYAHIKGDIKEQEIYNNNGIVIIAKGFNFTKTDPQFMLEIKNNAEHDYEFTVENVSINRYIMDAVMKKTIYPGTKEETNISFVNITMIDQRIKTIEELAFTINMTDGETKLSTGEIVLKTGLKADEYPELVNGTTVLEQDGIKVTYLDMEYPNKYHYGVALYFCIENTLTDEITMVTYDREATVNDKKVDAHFSGNVSPNKRIITELEIDNKDLEVAKISTVETVSVDDWFCSNSKTHETIFKNATFTLENLSETVVELDRGQTE